MITKSRDLGRGINRKRLDGIGSTHSTRDRWQEVEGSETESLDHRDAPLPNTNPQLGRRDAVSGSVHDLFVGLMAGWTDPVQSAQRVEFLIAPEAFSPDDLDGLGSTFPTVEVAKAGLVVPPQRSPTNRTFHLPLPYSVR